MNIKHLILTTLMLCTFEARAFDMKGDFIELKPNPPAASITKGDVVVEVKRLYQGRILSISKDLAHGSNCHVVKLLTETSEFKTINVSCSK